MNPEDDPNDSHFSEAAASSTVEFHEEKGIYRTQFDLCTRPASRAIIATVAIATGKDQLELLPLYSAIDPDALDDLMETAVHGDSKQHTTVSFEYADCRVSVKAHGRVLVEPDRDVRSN